MVIGWRVSTSMTTDLVMDGLKPGRLLTPNFARWSDCTLAITASQYTSIRYSERLAEIGARPSIGTIGDSYDNSLAESFNGLYKNELIKRRGPWRNADHLELATLAYIKWFNHRRLHSEIGDIPPAEMEMNYYNHHRPQPQVPILTRT